MMVAYCQKSPPRSARRVRFAHWDSRWSANPWLAHKQVIQMGKTCWHQGLQQEATLLKPEQTREGKRIGGKPSAIDLQ